MVLIHVIGLNYFNNFAHATKFLKNRLNQARKVLETYKFLPVSHKALKKLLGPSVWTSGGSHPLEQILWTQQKMQSLGKLRSEILKKRLRFPTREEAFTKIWGPKNVQWANGGKFAKKTLSLYII